MLQFSLAKNKSFSAIEKLPTVIDRAKKKLDGRENCSNIPSLRWEAKDKLN
jgi:hypothetical protein